MILSNRSDIPELMRAMDVFVFPSLFEGLGIVLIEAQVSGIRCIVSDTVPKEAFRSDLTVAVSLNQSPSEWCDVILDESIKGECYGDLDEYDMNKEIKRLEKLYEGELYS
jgi:glycosyltransferase involved in cell wall biosynthesis